ncbi:MAG: hypothetical protein HY905_24770 [Deltaproteobacteria bacterium]|nr:hypothetical protein [Deltaproteobacteria bacterium]
MMLRPVPAVAIAGLLLACGPGSTGAEEPVPRPAHDPAADAADPDAGPAADAPAPAPDAPPAEVGPLPGPPGADPPGFDVYEPLPEGMSLTRVLWKIDGLLAAADLRQGVEEALGEIATCLDAASAGGRLPMHLIIESSGRVVEVGAPLADAGLRDAITCAQVALRALRFPESTGDTTVHLILER